MLVTGFGPFRDIAENPSEVLAERLSANFVILPVQYSQVEAFARSVDENTILCLGVNAKLTEPVFELYGHNEIGAEPDITNRKREPKEIKRGAPRTLGQTLASPAQLIQLPMKTSFTPGSYLCNFILYSLLIRYPDRRIGFVHVPKVESMSIEDQLARLRRMLEHLDLS